MNKSTLVSIIVIVIVVLGGLFLLQRADAKPGELDTFAACLGEKGAKFYGAFWCPHCGEQKEMFGRSVEKLPYVECSTPDSKGQTEACISAGIQSYPTWDFADASRVTGVQTLSFLSQKTGCPLPSDEPLPASDDIGGTSEAL